MKDKYFYCACDAQARGGDKVNETHRFYFRLYRGELPDKDLLGNPVLNGTPILVEQGLHEQTDNWVAKYHAVFSHVNPYPNLD